MPTHDHDTPATRTLLPLLTRRPARVPQPVTCHYRCGNACDQPEPNHHRQPPHPRRDRHGARRVARCCSGAAVGAGALAVGTLAAARGRRTGRRAPARPCATVASTDAGLPPVAPNKRDAVVRRPTATGTTAGHQLGRPGAARAPRRSTCDRRRRRRRRSSSATTATTSASCRCAGDNGAARGQPRVHRRGADVPRRRLRRRRPIKRIAMASHGMSVVKIQRGRHARARGGASDPRAAPYNRRITAHHAVRARRPGRRGRPAAGPPPTRRARTVLGTLNNCAGGITPWGTVLSGEENFNQYFDKTGDARPALHRVATPATASPAPAAAAGATVDPRFDLTAEPHEPFRFGWIVEVDPLRPGRRRRASTRCSAGSSTRAPTSRIADNGQAVAYMGDDERGDYIYKFVSARQVRPAATPQAAQAHNLHAAHRRARCTSPGSPATADRTPASSTTAPASGSRWPPTRVVRRGHERRRRAHRHPAGRRQGRADHGWTGPRTSSRTRSTARSTPR